MKASEIASRLGLRLKGSDTEVMTVCSYENIKEGALVPLLGKLTSGDVFSSSAAAFLMKNGTEPDSGRTFLLADDPEMAVVGALELLHPKKKPAAGIHPMACVAPDAKIGGNVSIGAFSYVGSGCVIGDGCIIHNNVSISDGAVLGKDCEIYPNATVYGTAVLKDRVTLHSGSVIGADGFGYYPRNGVHVKIPHIGGVILENDVEIGANSCVDRGKFDATVIGEGTKIDNQCMVGHNCVLGRGCIMAGQAALAGSTTLGDYVVMGARSGASDHVKIAPKTMLAGQCGVISDIDKPGIYAGFPHTGRKAWAREQALVRDLPEIVKRITDIERKLKDDGH